MTEEEAAARRLARLDRFARWLDSSMRIPGTELRVGADAWIGLIPVVGDVAGATLSAYVIREAMKLGVPRRTLARMLLNVAIELALGSVPLIGDLFDAGFHANVRNVGLAKRAVAVRERRLAGTDGPAHR